MKTFVVDSIYFTSVFFFMAARALPMRSASSLTRGSSASSRAFCVTGCHSTGEGTGAFIYLLTVHMSDAIQVVRASSNTRPGGMRPLANVLIAMWVQARWQCRLGSKIQKRHRVPRGLVALTFCHGDNRGSIGPRLEIWMVPLQLQRHRPSKTVADHSANLGIAV